ncbi:MAG: hypothetical protein AB4426_09265 [Xenococcaceae cyanobacterium]
MSTIEESSMARPGGNPGLEVYKFKTDRKEPLNAKLSIWVAPSMLDRLKSRDNWRDLVRDAIAEKLEKLESKGPLQNTG